MKNFNFENLEKRVNGGDFTSKLLSFYTGNNLSKSTISQSPVCNSNDKTNLPNISGTLQLNSQDNSIHTNSSPHGSMIQKSRETIKTRKIRKGQFGSGTSEQLKPDYSPSNENATFSPEVSPLSVFRFKNPIQKPFVEEYSSL